MSFADTTQEPMTSLLDLNDDCLFEIFKYLNLMETFNVLDLRNSRLTGIARQRIATFKELNIQIRELPNFTWTQLKIIGKNLRIFSLIVGYSIPTQTVLNIIKPLCQGAALTAQLREFSLNYVYFNEEFCQCIGDAVTKVQRVNLSYCQLTDEILSEFLKKCVSLRELYILGNYTLNGDFLRNFHTPSLRTIRLELHAAWTFPLGEFKTKYPNILLITT
ncbi:PREDICTED: uncharacterized protein LOC108358984 isoform X2 [Rhagoletis zephyria]|uniref:uncharacterized protein LOC108358984 isoform X2 n=2 Tax=Rhagoletis zephyria TaxID=28612 RepID=UPI00081123A8|nr:PREDICTED: uncharacterized protein LOC108358984 isoform X2 [Rhagoletis zephyria]